MVAYLAATLGQLEPPPPAPAPAVAIGATAISGQVDVLADRVTSADVSELRPRVSVEIERAFSHGWRARFDGYAEALVADREGRTTAAIAAVRDAWIEIASSRADLRVGYGRVVWGRLDEIQPSDVINPINVTRFLFDGRGAARLPVTFVRGRVFATERLTLEGVFVPLFRRGTFDELDEASSPFNPRNQQVTAAAPPAAGLEIERQTPSVSWANVSGGGRLLATVGRVDVAFGAFRGFEGFGLVSFEPTPAAGPAVVGKFVEVFPRTTMVAGDFETVVGEWELRGEAAFFVEKTLQGGIGPVRGRALDAGAGFDRANGGFRAFGSVLLHRQWSDVDPGVNRTDVSLIGSIEQQFKRDRHLARVFAVVTPHDRSGFVRGLYAWKMRDDLALEVSAAAFVGERSATPGRFESPDFLFTRLRYYW